MLLIAQAVFKSCCRVMLISAVMAVHACRSVAQERSLLTGEVGMATVKLLAAPGRLDGYNSTVRFLENLLGGRMGDKVGKLRIITENGSEGVAVDVPARTAAAVLAAADQAVAQGVAVSKPHSLPVDVKEMVLGRQGRRAPGSDRGISPRGSFRGGRDRDRGSRDGGYKGRDNRDSWGGGRDGYRGRDRDGGRSSRDGGGYGRDGGSRGSSGKFGWENDGGRSSRGSSGGGGRGGKSKGGIW